MQRDGDDEQPDPAQAVRLRSPAAIFEMFVRHQQVQRPQAGGAQQDAGSDHRRPGAGLERWKDQGEEGRSQHHSGGEAEQRVLYAFGNAAHQQQGNGTKAGCGTSREAG